jgi:hypothetical protein
VNVNPELKSLGFLFYIKYYNSYIN